MSNFSNDRVILSGRTKYITAVLKNQYFDDTDWRYVEERALNYLQQHRELMPNGVPFRLLQKTNERNIDERITDYKIDHVKYGRSFYDAKCLYYRGPNWENQFTIPIHTSWNQYKKIKSSNGYYFIITQLKYKGNFFNIDIWDPNGGDYIY